MFFIGTSKFWKKAISNIIKNITIFALLGLKRHVYLSLVLLYFTEVHGFEHLKKQKSFFNKSLDISIINK